MARTSIIPDLAEKINDANTRLEGVKDDLHIPTPLVYAHRLSQEVTELYNRRKDHPIRVWVKMENLQRTGSFKIRGAYNKLKTLRDQRPSESEVVAASAGNHAQGVALAAKLLGIGSKIYVPRTAPSFKLRAIASYGGELEEEDDLDCAITKAKERSKDPLGSADLFIHPYDDWDIIAGQGTIGLEIYQQLSQHIENLDDHQFTVVVPVGGGGLAAGIAFALKETKHCEDCCIIGVQSEKASAVMQSFYAEKIKPDKPGYTIADGIKVECPGEKPFMVLRRYMNYMCLRSAIEISHAVYKLLSIEKTVAEPAGAAAMAAILSEEPERRPEIHGDDVVVVVSGGNIDLSTLTWGAMQEHSRAGFVFRVEGWVPDEPGTLVEVANVCQNNNGNILLVREERIRPDIPPGHGSIMMYIEILGQLDSQNPRRHAKGKIQSIVHQLNQLKQCSNFKVMPWEEQKRSGG